MCDGGGVVKRVPDIRELVTSNVVNNLIEGREMESGLGERRWSVSSSWRVWRGIHCW